MRCIIEITGEDRIHFLQGIVTQDVNLLATQPILFAALLTPQGKLAHDFFLIKQSDAILLDTHTAQKEALLKRLAMYKLRAKVTLRDAPEITVGYGSGHADPRHAEMPKRGYGTPGALTDEQYHTQRLALGIPESPYDTAEDVAMDLGYDLLNAISFTKGCYVGQEVTARMHHKDIARRGFYIVESDAPLAESRPEVKAGELKAGSLRGVRGARGLALLKFGEVVHAQSQNIPLTVDNRPIRVRLPDWMAPKFATFTAAHTTQS